MFYMTIGANEYYSFVVSPDFLDSPSFNLTAADLVKNGTQEDKNVYPVLEDLWSQAISGTLHNLSSSECISAYDDDIQNTYRNVLAITVNRTENSSILDYTLSSPRNSSNSWLCGRVSINEFLCDTSDLLQDARRGQPWKYLIWTNDTSRFSHRPEDTPSRIDDDVLKKYPPLNTNLAVSYCLAEKGSPNACTLHFAYELMPLIICANIAKLACLLWLLCKQRAPCLVTLGDAVASFLRVPDPHTRHHALAVTRFRTSRKSCKQTRHRLWLEDARGTVYGPDTWSDAWHLWPHTWMSAISTRQWQLSGL